MRAEVIAEQRRVAVLEAALRETRETLWRVSQYDRMVINYAGELQEAALSLDAVLAGGDAAPDENFAARVQEARRVLATGDEAEAIAYLVGASVEDVRQVAGGDALAERARVLATVVRQAMEQDCGPAEAEPYASWAKALAEFVIELTT